MGNGLLAWWHRRIASHGMAGAVLCVVPVAAAALIGWGTSFSGIASGLSAVTSGPDNTIPASAQTHPGGLNRAVLALAGKSGSSVGPNSDRSTTIGADGGSGGNGKVVGTGGAGGTTGPSGSSTVGSTGSSGGSGGGSGSSTTINTSLPGTGGASDTVNNTVGSVNNTVGSANNTVGSVNNTVGSVNNTVGSTVDSVNNTLGGAGSTVDTLLGH
jgi:hypothetical protein